MLSFDQLRKKIKRKFFEEKIDFELQIALKNDSRNANFKYVKKKLLTTILNQVRDKFIKIDRMLFDAKTRISLIRNFKLNELEILRRSDKFFITFFLLFVL